MQSNQDPLAVPPPGEDFDKELPSAGEHQAVCCQIHNLGYQEYQGKVSPSPKCVLIFELAEKMKNGENAGRSFVLSEQFNMFLGKDGKLRTFLESWRGATFTEEQLSNFTLRNLLSKPATIMVVHEPKKNKPGMRAKIAGVAKPKGPAFPPTYNDVPKWVTETQAKQVRGPARSSPTPSTPPPAPDDGELPF